MLGLKKQTPAAVMPAAKKTTIPADARIELPERTALQAAIAAHAEIDQRLRMNAEVLTHAREIETTAEEEAKAAGVAFADASVHGEAKAAHRDFSAARDAHEAATARRVGLERQRVALESELHASVALVETRLRAFREAEGAMLQTAFDSICERFRIEVEEIHAESYGIDDRLFHAINRIDVRRPGEMHCKWFRQRPTAPSDNAALLQAARRAIGSAAEMTAEELA